MNMRKKEILATCILWVLTGGTSLGYTPRDYIVNENSTWYETTIGHVPPGGSGIWLFCGFINVYVFFLSS